MISFPASMLAALPGSMPGRMLGRILETLNIAMSQSDLMLQIGEHSPSPESLLLSLTVFLGYGCVRIAKVTPQGGEELIEHLSFTLSGIEVGSEGERRMKLVQMFLLELLLWEKRKHCPECVEESDWTMRNKKALLSITCKS